MKRPRWFFLCLLMTVSSSIHLGVAAAERPNVLFVLCDDIRPDAVGCYGPGTFELPTLMPSHHGAYGSPIHSARRHSAPQSGQHPHGTLRHRHGVRDNFTELPEKWPHWPARLHDAGYATAYLGKWHMGEDNDEPRPGFDWFITHKGQGKYFDTEWNVTASGAKHPKATTPMS